MSEQMLENTEQTVTNGNRKRVTMIFLSVVVVIALVGGTWWWHIINTTISTDNAKVTGDVADISPKVSGRLDSVLFKEGDYVKAGQVIFKLDDSQYKIAAAQAEAALQLAQANYDKLPDDMRSIGAAYIKAQQGLASAQAGLISAQATLADAKRALDQDQQLYTQGAISKETFDKVNSTYTSAKAGLQTAQANLVSAQASLQDAGAKKDSEDKTGNAIYLAQLKQAQAAYDNAELSYNNCMVTAPISGTVVRIPAEVGEIISAGETVLTISDLDTTWITANIEEKKIGRVKVGQTVDVRIDAFPGQVFKGVVSEVGGAAESIFSLIPTENTSGNYTKVVQRLPIKIKVNKQDQIFKPGMSAVITIHTAN